MHSPSINNQRPSSSRPAQHPPGAGSPVASKSDRDKTLLAIGGLSDRMLHHVLRTLQQQFARSLQTDRQQRQKQSSNLIAWAQAYLPNYFRAPPSKMHCWLAEQLEQMRTARGTKLNVLGPRGGAKSTVATMAYVLRCALEKREPYIWIVSDTRQQANAHLESVKQELTCNTQLANAYPEATGRGRVWRTGVIQLRNGVKIEAYGTAQRIRGRRHNEHRPSLIICDDLQNDQHVSSPQLRTHSRHWFQSALMKAGDKETNFVNLATALHRDALAMQLHTSPGWKSKQFQAIVRWPKNMSRWIEWEALYANPLDKKASEHAREFYLQHQSEMDEDAELLWPEREDLYALMCMRVESGRTTFEREKQNSPVNAEQCEWPESYFGEWIWFDEWPTDLSTKVIALDPSKGEGARTSDYSAFVLLGVHPSGQMYIEADLARRPTPQMVADGVELCRQFRAQALAIETNQFQQLLQSEFERELSAQNMHAMPIWTFENRMNKQVRIRRLGPLLARRRFRFKASSPSTRLLVDQLKDFPMGEHDDGPDALEMAIRLIHDLAGNELASAAPPDDGLGNCLIPH